MSVRRGVWRVVADAAVGAGTCVCRPRRWALGGAAGVRGARARHRQARGGHRARPALTPAPGCPRAAALLCSGLWSPVPRPAVSGRAAEPDPCFAPHPRHRLLLQGVLGSSTGRKRATLVPVAAGGASSSAVAAPTSTAATAAGASGEPATKTPAAVDSKSSLGFVPVRRVTKAAPVCLEPLLLPRFRESPVSR